MRKQNIEPRTAAVTELYRRETDRLSELTREAEELLAEGEMLYRERVLRDAELARARVNAIKDVAALFGVDVEKGR